MTRGNISGKILLLSGLVFSQAVGLAQLPNRATNPGDNLRTVEVGSVNRVTLRFFAPSAATVTVGGDFLMGAPVAALTKGNDGVWAFTSNPLPPDSYTYNFNVDGVMVLDTRNPNFKENPNSLFNFFDMPGPETEFMALKDVPHGRVERVIYHSAALNMERQIHVYLPPNFEKIKGKLPVLYLLHGAGDNDLSWTSAGQVDMVLDNLYADGKVKDMIVVMPSGHVPGQARARMLSPVEPETDPFSKDFLNDLMPFVEKTYGISTKREDTAIAGFSMGGGQALNLCVWHPEKFGSIFLMSTGYFPDSLKQMEEQYSGVLEAFAKHSFKPFMIGKGKDDQLVAKNSQATMAMFDTYGVHYEYKELNGAHSFVFCRRFLASAFPVMFR